MTPEQAVAFCGDGEDPAEIFAAFSAGVNGITAEDTARFAELARYD